jgi:transcriptional regulator with XRE-family HTH domain
MVWLRGTIGRVIPRKSAASGHPALQFGTPADTRGQLGDHVTDDLFTEDLDIASVQTRAALAAMLRTIHIRADRPSLRVLEARTRHDVTPLSKTVVSEMLKGTRFPRKAVMVSFLRTCGVPENMVEPWLRTWERIAASEQDPASYRTATVPDRVTSRFTIPADTRHEAPAASQEPGPQGLDDTADGEIPPGRARGPVIRRRELGALLRGLRVAAGMTIEQVAIGLLCSPSKVSRMETGYRSVTLRDVRDLCDLYQVTDAVQRDHLMELAREGRRQGWWQSYDLPFGTFVGLEADATSISTYHGSLVPGLLQTADYARAIMKGVFGVDTESIERHLTVRLTRQRLLTQDSPLQLHVIMDEAVLHRIIGQPAVMKAQLDHIIEKSSLPNVTIQVMPYDAGVFTALDNSFTILDFPGVIPGITYIEGLFGFIYLERVQDVDRYRRAFHDMEPMAANDQRSIDLIAGRSRELSEYA